MSRQRGRSPNITHSPVVNLDPDRAGRWVIRHHRRGLIQRTIRRKPKWGAIDDQGITRESGFRMSLAELQRMHLRKLQIQLVEDMVTMCELDEDGTDFREPAHWEDHLKAYTQGIRDYEYMKHCSQQLRDPFLITAERSVDDYILASLVPRNAALTDILSNELWESEDETTPIGGTRHETHRETAQKAFAERLLMAIVGALFLVAPMWLMVLHNTMWTSLASTSVFVIVFGVLVAWHLEDKEKVLASTAAYAAVLVVFVGLNVESSSVKS